jgi:hypothetical protein
MNIMPNPFEVLKSEMDKAGIQVDQESFRQAIEIANHPVDIPSTIAEMEKNNIEKIKAATALIREVAKAEGEHREWLNNRAEKGDLYDVDDWALEERRKAIVDLMEAVVAGTGTIFYYDYAKIGKENTP